MRLQRERSADLSAAALRTRRVMVGVGLAVDAFVLISACLVFSEQDVNDKEGCTQVGVGVARARRTRVASGVVELPV